MNGARASTLTETRRQHQRTPCCLPVAYTIKPTGERGSATAVNIGLGGLRIDFPVEITLPAEVELAVTFPGRDGGTPTVVEIAAKVVWTVTEVDGGPWPTGLMFQTLEDGLRRRLYDLITSVRG